MHFMFRAQTYVKIYPTELNEKDSIVTFEGWKILIYTALIKKISALGKT